MISESLEPVGPKNLTGRRIEREQVAATAGEHPAVMLHDGDDAVSRRDLRELGLPRDPAVLGIDRGHAAVGAQVEMHGSSFGGSSIRRAERPGVTDPILSPASISAARAPGRAAGVPPIPGAASASAATPGTGAPLPPACRPP